MRTDESLDPSIRDNEQWQVDNQRTVALIDGSATVTQSRVDGLRASFSGFERNRLFISQQAETFHDLSGVSGLDSEKDGRVFVKWDFDKDGWTDIAIVNTNRPLLNLYRNQLGEQRENQAPNFIAIRLVGGNQTGRPSTEWSARDGYGARLTIKAGDLIQTREHQCGEGMAAQNSKTLLVGLGDQSQADALTIRWPSGKVQEIGEIAAGTLITVFENPAESPDSTGFSKSDYQAR